MVDAGAADRLGGHRWKLVGWLVLTLGMIGGALLALASAGNQSPGAVDNASGVVTVMAAAALLNRNAPVGVLITDAEEIGLAGARDWVTGRAAGIAINCDTVDDDGTLMLLTLGRRPERLLRAAERGALAAGLSCHVRRTPLGVLTDGVAFARAGWTCVTLSRATVGTLMRIHTARDSVEHLAGTGIASAAAFLAATVQELL